MTILQPGDPAPPFELSDQDGNTVRSADFSGRYLFIFFYPKANTSG
jgi:peroxiredoxin Q/BCP